MKVQLKINQAIRPVTLSQRESTTKLVTKNSFIIQSYLLNGSEAYTLFKLSYLEEV